MEIIKKYEVIQNAYYDCSVNAEHRHRTEEVAKRCYEYDKNRTPKKDFSPRNRSIIESLLNGESPKNLGECFNLSQARIGQIIVNEIRHATRWNRLHNMGLLEHLDVVGFTFKDWKYCASSLKVLLSPYWANNKTPQDSEES